jgi:RNA polymerase sigma factor (sigma-70 family)
MRYIINNEKSIRNEAERETARKVIGKQVRRLDRITRNYPKPVVVDVYFNMADRNTYLVSAVVNLKGDMIYLKEKGQNIEAVLHSLFDRMKLTLSRKIHKEKREYLYKRKTLQHAAFMENLPELQDLRKETTRPVFNQLLKIILNDVARYIRRRIKSAEMTTAVKRGRFKIQELLDELYMRIYDRIDSIPGDEIKTRAWLYHLADEILQEKFREIEFEDHHFEDLDKIVDAEYRSLEESFTIDGEQEIIPVEELDGFEQMEDLYSAEDLVYGEDENTLLDELTLKLNQEEIHTFIEKELAKLPLFKRTIMDLHLIGQMSVDEIAEIKQISPTEVEAVLREVNADLIRKFTTL